VSDYLDQLALRVQQPEFAVQPRPVSRFESPSHATLVTPEPPAPEEADEPGSPSAVIILSETGVDKPEQHTDNHNRHEAETEASLSVVARPVKESHTPHPGQSTTEPPIVTHPVSTEATHHSLHAVTYPALRRQPTEQRARIDRSPVEPVQPPVRLDKPMDHADIASSNLSGRRELAGLAERIVRGEREQTQPLAGSKRPTGTAGNASFNLLRRPEFTEFQEPVVRDTRERIPQSVKIVNPVEKSASPLAPGTTYHGQTEVESEPSGAEPLFGRQAELMPKAGFAPMPEREVFKPLAEPTAPPLGVERSADTPTIQVTIGRVEIRATVESPPARKPQAKAPVMSLDEYLRQRNGGRG
jgi:hypothetical protein